MATTEPLSTALQRQSALIWACEHASVVHPKYGRLSFRPHRFQAKFLMDRSRRRLVVKARQIGMSQAVAIEAVHGAQHNPDSTALLVSRNREQAEELLQYCVRSIDGVAIESPIIKQNMSYLAFANGGRIISLPANKATGRGFSGYRVYLDEYAYQQYAADIYRSVSPILSHGGQLTVFSTPNGRANHFYQLWSGLDGGEWSRHVFDWTECPYYDQAWYDRTRPDYTSADWASEYGCDFVASGQAVFTEADILACADGWRGLQSARSHRIYLTAWDIGRRRDATVGVTLDITEEPWQIVAFDRLLGISYPVIQRHIEQRSAQYPGDVWIESNGPGDPVIENLNITAKPFLTTARSKAQAITSLAWAHEGRRLKHDIEQLRKECQLYQWDDEQLIQDSVMAAAIAVHQARESMPPEVY